MTSITGARVKHIDVRRTFYFHRVAVGFVVFILSALALGTAGIQHQESLTVTPRTGTVVSTEEHVSLVSCGKAVCPIFTYPTRVNVGGEVVEVVRSGRADNGSQVTVFETNGHNFNADNPQSFWSLALVALIAAVLGVFLGWATTRVIEKLAYPWWG